MNLGQALSIVEAYQTLQNYIYDNAERVWNAYVAGKTRAYNEYNETWKIRKYDYERLEIDEDTPYVIYETYYCGESDNLYFLLSNFFDEDFENTIYEETVASIQKRIEDKEQERIAEEEADKQREIRTLKKLAEQYPEVINALSRDLSNSS